MKLIRLLLSITCFSFIAIGSGNATELLSEDFEDITTLGSRSSVNFTSNGYHGDGMAFNAPGSYIKYNSSYFPSQGTFEAYVNIAQDNPKWSRDSIFDTNARGGYSGTHIALYITNEQKLVFRVWGSGISQIHEVNSNSTLSLNEWYAIGVSWGSQGVYIYINGVLDASDTSLTYRWDADEPVYLGDCPDDDWAGSNYYNSFFGTMDSVRTSNVQKDITYSTDTEDDNSNQPSDEGVSTLQGFDKNYYLAVKLAALQTSNSGWVGKTVDDLESVLRSYGLTAETHYSQFGYKEGCAPNAYFNHSEYLQAKATTMYYSGGYSSVEDAQVAFIAAWPGDSYLHYLSFGSAEGLNPSNSFDESEYLSDKLASIQSEVNSWDGKTIVDLRQHLSSIGMSTLGHYILHGQYEGLSPTPVSQDELEIPEENQRILIDELVEVPVYIHSITGPFSGYRKKTDETGTVRLIVKGPWEISINEPIKLSVILASEDYLTYTNENLEAEQIEIIGRDDHLSLIGIPSQYYYYPKDDGWFKTSPPSKFEGIFMNLMWGSFQTILSSVLSPIDIFRHLPTAVDAIKIIAEGSDDLNDSELRELWEFNNTYDIYEVPSYVKKDGTFSASKVTAKKYDFQVQLTNLDTDIQVIINKLDFKTNNWNYTSESYDYLRLCDDDEKDRIDLNLRMLY